MTAPSRDELLGALDVLEESDARNLAWGLTDESWTREGLAEFLRQHWDGADPQVCIDELLAENLIVQLPRAWPARYRTRMAEAVRLFTRLRQLFPGQPWQSGSRLVSDFRFLRRPRAFPERNLATPESPRAPARAGTPRRRPHTGRARPGRAGTVALSVDRHLRNLLRASIPE